MELLKCSKLHIKASSHRVILHPICNNDFRSSKPTGKQMQHSVPNLNSNKWVIHLSKPSQIDSNLCRHRRSLLEQQAIAGLEYMVDSLWSTRTLQLSKEQQAAISISKCCSSSNSNYSNSPRTRHRHIRKLTQCQRLSACSAIERTHNNSKWPAVRVMVHSWPKKLHTHQNFYYIVSESLK